MYTITSSQRYHRPMKWVQGSLGFRIPHVGFLIQGTGFRSLVCGTWIPVFSGSGNRITRAVLRIPKPRILDSRNKISWILDSSIPESLTLGDYQFALVCCQLCFRPSNKRFEFHFDSWQRDTVKLRRHAQ